MRGHVLFHHSHVPVAVQLVNLRPKPIAVLRIRETFGVVAGAAADACRPWLAEASQDRDPKRRHLLEDNPAAG